MWKDSVPIADQPRERFKQTLTRLSLAKHTELEEAAASHLAAFSNMAQLSLKDVKFQVTANYYSNEIGMYVSMD